MLSFTVSEITHHHFLSVLCFSWTLMVVFLFSLLLLPFIHSNCLYLIHPVSVRHILFRQSTGPTQHETKYHHYITGTPPIMPSWPNIKTCYYLYYVNANVRQPSLFSAFSVWPLKLEHPADKEIQTTSFSLQHPWVPIWYYLVLRKQHLRLIDIQLPQIAVYWLLSASWTFSFHHSALQQMP